MRSLNCIGGASLWWSQAWLQTTLFRKSDSRAYVVLFTSGILGIRTPTKFLNSNNNMENNYKEKNAQLCVEQLFVPCLVGFCYFLVVCIGVFYPETALIRFLCTLIFNSESPVSFLSEIEIWVLLLTQQNCFHHQMCNF